VKDLLLGTGPLTLAVSLVLLAPAWSPNQYSLASAASAPARNETSATRLAASYGRLPVSFEINQGQTDSAVQFLAHGRGYTLFLTSGEAVLSLQARSTGNSAAAGKGKTPAVQSSVESSFVRLALIGSNSAAEASGLNPLPGKSNYFIGPDPSKWRRDVPTFEKVHYRDVYPGVDLVYYGNQEGRLEHDFVVAAGADPTVIAMRLDSASHDVQCRNGELTVQTSAGTLTMQAPIVYQTLRGQRKVIPASYELAHGNEIRFHLGSYDRNAPLVIDPVLTHTAVFGGSESNEVLALAIDTHGNAYVAGATSSLDFPTVNPFQSSWTAVNQSSSAGFVSKVNAAGTALIYSTYLGGPSTVADAITVDSSGRAYVAGLTGSGFPVKNAYQSKYGGGQDAFYLILGNSGNSILYSTYIGGDKFDYATAMTRDASGNVYLTGRTDGDFPALNSIKPSGTPGVWVAKFNSSNKLQYSTMYGNIEGQSADIAADASGSAYIVGYTNADDIPVTPGAFSSTCGINGCGWAAKLSPSGSSLVYSTALGVGGGGAATSIALDSSNNAYIGGATPRGLPASSTAFQKQFGGSDNDGFVLRLNPTGTALLSATYLGGSSEDVIYGLALDQYHNVYVSGWTCSPNFPLQASIRSFSVTSDRPCQFFVTTLNPTLSSIPYYSTLFGGPTASNQEIKIKVDQALNVYLAGYDLGNVNATPGALDDAPVKDNNFNVFVSKLDIVDDLSLALTASSSSVTPGQNLTYTITVKSNGPDFGTNVLITDSVPSGATFVSVAPGGSTCRAPAVGGLGPINCTLPRLNKGATWVVKMTVKVNANIPHGTVITDSAATKSNMQDFNINNGIGAVNTSVN
jgi:uncharacterized repeat protein (TIGR01451 family)